MRRREFISTSTGVLGLGIVSRTIESQPAVGATFSIQSKLSPNQVTSDNVIVTLSDVLIQASNISDTDSDVSLDFQLYTDTNNKDFESIRKYNISLTSRDETVRIPSVSFNIGSKSSQDISNASRAQLRLVASHPDVSTAYSTETLILDPNIPEVWLSDDWGDNSLVNRSKTEETTYDGTTWQSYRPEWSSYNNNYPSVNNGTLIVDGGESIETKYELDFESKITWKISNLDISPMASNYGDGYIALFATDLTNKFTTTNNSITRLNKSYMIRFNESGGVALNARYENQNSSRLISGSMPSSADIKVVRRLGGEWELFVDNNSQGVAEDTTYTTVDGTYFFGRDNSETEYTLDNYKIH